MKIKVLYEDDYTLVLDKPAFLSVHGDGKTEEETLADYLIKNYPETKMVGEDIVVHNGSHQKLIKKPGIVHRLDKETSGCILIAKSPEAYFFYKRQFQNREIKKEYVAIVYGVPKHDTGMIDAPIARSKTDFRKKDIVSDVVNDLESDTRGEDREAFTRYKLEKEFTLDDVTGTHHLLSLMHFYPKTGRTHQIRVHAKSVRHPIVGDYLYGYKKPFLEKKIFGSGKVRQLLHAKSLEFHLFDSAKTLKIQSDLPKEFDVSK